MILKVLVGLISISVFCCAVDLQCESVCVGEYMRIIIVSLSCGQNHINESA